jgi:hypothetical protein
MPRGTPCKNRFGAELLRRGITSEWLADRLMVHIQTVRSWRGMRTRNGRLVPRRTPTSGLLELLADELAIEATRTQTGAQRVLRMIRTPVTPKK